MSEAVSAMSDVDIYKNRAYTAAVVAGVSAICAPIYLFGALYLWVMAPAHDQGANDTVFVLALAVISAVLCPVALVVRAAEIRAMKRAMSEQDAKAHLAYPWR